jgi:beta-glucosidase
MSRIERLLERMTLAEKLGQLTMTASSYAVTGPVIAGDSTDSIRNGTIGNLLNMVGAEHVHEMQRIAVEQSRLGIPLLIGLDILHGHRMLFPIPLAEAATFDPGTWWLSAREAAREGAADGLAMTFAPMLDVSRDPRWGRTAEGPGEDPWLAQAIAVAKVRGFQGTEHASEQSRADLDVRQSGTGLASPESLAACAKHFCAYGPVTAGREYASVDVSERALREVHLPAFAAAVRAGVAAIMPAFTDLAGVPMTAHVRLLRDYLRGELGFDGVLISDYNAIGELIKHGVAADLADAATLALKAGIDIDMMADAYRRGLPVALERGRVSIEEIDIAVRRVLRLKEQLGLFDAPYGRGARREASETLAQRRKLARSIAQRSIVLLQNDGGVLPLSASIRRISLLGPLADAASEMRGCWAAACEAEGHVSVLGALRNALPRTQIRHAAGVSIDGEDQSGIESAVELCEGAEAILLCLGEAATMSGEAASRAHLDLPGRQRALAEAVLDRAGGLRIPVAVILFSGRPLTIPWLAGKANALLAAWFLGNEAGNAIADVVTGRVSPSGRTPITWPRALGQVPIFFGQRSGGRPFNPEDHYTSKYIDELNEPLYPFGHGLTYGRFSLSNLRVSASVLGEDGVIDVQVDVKNEGARRAQETVFLFTHDKLASVTRPLLELKGFTKAALEPGASQTVTLRLSGAQLRFPGLDLEPVFEAGELEILVGPCADRARLLGTTIMLRG